MLFSLFVVTLLVNTFVNSKTITWDHVVPNSPPNKGYFVVETMPNKVERTTYMEVHIYPNDVRTRSGSFSTSLKTKLFHDLNGVTGDVAGHILANTFGGPNTATNFFPQAPSVNSNAINSVIVTWDNVVQNAPEAKGYYNVETMPSGIERTTHMEVHIYLSDVRERSGSFSRTLRANLFDDLGAVDGDVAGHILANTLGGTNTAINFFPQAPSVNSNVDACFALTSWFENENDIRRWLRGDDLKFYQGNINGVRSVLYRVALEYPDDNIGRPSKIYFKTFFQINGYQIAETKGEYYNLKQDSHQARII
ncbi:unnamed protein product [Bursaphelenchus okinawaensis]|uniref:Uncharacterized protein n=1 Tax=Bursaphelenchus okinawaensis TaxID=465554 RepID=A0A811KSD6_9BILA|nr:unnamed protein product [Bursaphelenchus okinawaensis]CAG9109717.1 unnamed protein product [Bursaphelenchus okinawaensis]